MCVRTYNLIMIHDYFLTHAILKKYSKIQNKLYEDNFVIDAIHILNLSK